LENNCSSVCPAGGNKLAFITCLPFNIFACFYESLFIKQMQLQAMLARVARSIGHNQRCTLVVLACS